MWMKPAPSYPGPGFLVIGIHVNHNADDYQLLILQAALDELLLSDVAVIVDVEGGEDLHRSLYRSLFFKTLAS